MEQVQKLARAMALVDVTGRCLRDRHPHEENEIVGAVGGVAQAIRSAALVFDVPPHMPVPEIEAPANVMSLIDETREILGHAAMALDKAAAKRVRELAEGPLSRLAGWAKEETPDPKQLPLGLA